VKALSDKSRQQEIVDKRRNLQKKQPQ